MPCGKRLRFWVFAATTGGWLAAGSCFSTAFENLDLFLSRNAVDAALRIPYAVVGPLIEAIIQAVNFI
ncbi:MAG: hypothetical protein JNG88_10795 [Phycisphaerales bacterium]|nr:hypothetical protein [Phycisphaerales bacterium]